MGIIITIVIALLTAIVTMQIVTFLFENTRNIGIYSHQMGVVMDSGWYS